VLKIRILILSIYTLFVPTPLGYRVTVPADIPAEGRKSTVVEIRHLLLFDLIGEDVARYSADQLKSV